jgi:ABC-2 type transport system ATP-binding protein
MPVLSARGAGVRHKRRWLFRELDVTVEAGEIVAVTGPPGSGRTTALLALARRFKLSAGTVELRGKAPLGYVPGVHAPEEVLTVAEHVTERRLLTGSTRTADLRGLDPDAKGYELSPYQRHLLGLALAELSDPALIAVDATDEGLDTAERKSLREALGELADRGVAIIYAAREADEANLITLGGGEK